MTCDASSLLNISRDFYSCDASKSSQTRRFIGTRTNALPQCQKWQPPHLDNSGQQLPRACLPITKYVFFLGEITNLQLLTPSSSERLTMATFLDLPLEVRNMIYEYCLVKDSTLVPFKEFYPLLHNDSAFRKDLPTVALLLVNKTIEAEAAAIPYGKNVWRVSVNITYLTPVLSPPIPGPLSYLWKHRGNLFKNVIVVFDQRDAYSMEVITDTLITNFNQRLQTPEQRRNKMHDQIKSNVRFYWGLKFDFVSHMTSIRSLTLDVKLAFCHMGCCRTEALQWMLDVFSARFNLGDHHTYLRQLLDAGLQITVKGIWKDAEKDVFQGLGLPVRFVKENYLVG